MCGVVSCVIWCQYSNNIKENSCFLSAQALCFELNQGAASHSSSLSAWECHLLSLVTYNHAFLYLTCIKQPSKDKGLPLWHFLFWATSTISMIHQRFHYFCVAAMVLLKGTARWHMQWNICLTEFFWTAAITWKCHLNIINTFSFWVKLKACVFVFLHPFGTEWNCIIYNDLYFNALSVKLYTFANA